MKNLKLKKSAIQILLLSSAAICFNIQAEENTRAKEVKYIQYCQTKNGEVQNLQAQFLGSPSGLSKKYCKFTSDSGRAMIIGLETFSSEKSNIAASFVGILARSVDFTSPLLDGFSWNPASNFCRNLGGSGIGTYSPGGFTDEFGGQMDVCTFADGSSIGKYALLYTSLTDAGDLEDKIIENVNSTPLNISVPNF